ncbi:zf-DNL-domain-containing protein [Polyporus arcularius HHB13444]|uniref:Zf-DNL-domain-containing protein n=1 Tax=Polyporus arcularius HHB13444 TaxID=1314778 RepID=A0A5C3PXK2_9APHY|nr:zf-DNL-domain-containing protein [Polyporus arcularius HHB13444]
MLRPAFSSLQRPLSTVPRAHHGIRRFSSSPRTCRDSRPPHSKDAVEAPPASPTPQTHITLETPEPKLSLTFTCTVEACHTRSTHQFTKRSYEKGIVIVECPGCKNRHLIADHLGWFKESTQEGKLKTVEDLLRAKGEKVRRGRIDAGGVVEYAPE